MLGRIPKRVIAPALRNTTKLNLPNSPDISSIFCSKPTGQYVVEEVGSFKVVVKKPDSKKLRGKLDKCQNQSDFTVWVFETENVYWMPKHLETLRAFSKLADIDERNKLFKAIKNVVLDYLEPQKACEINDCKNMFIEGYPALLILSYLKWMAALEDTLYPPPRFLGRKLAFAGYVLVFSELYSPDEIRRLLKIW